MVATCDACLPSFSNRESTPMNANKHPIFSGDFRGSKQFPLELCALEIETDAHLQPSDPQVIQQLSIRVH
jgi:hypothetical protein